MCSAFILAYDAIGGPYTGGFFIGCWFAAALLLRHRHLGCYTALALGLSFAVLSAFGFGGPHSGRALAAVGLLWELERVWSALLLQRQPFQALRVLAGRASEPALPDSRRASFPVQLDCIQRRGGRGSHQVVLQWLQVLELQAEGLRERLLIGFLAGSHGALLRLVGTGYFPFSGARRAFTGLRHMTGVQGVRPGRRIRVQRSL